MQLAASPPRRLAAAFVATIAGLALGALVSSPDASAGPEPRASQPPKDADLLFALKSDSGKFEQSQDRPKRGKFRLTLRGLDNAALWFTDRPQRDSGTIPTPRLFRQWERLGFEEDPPNAVLSLLKGPDRADTVALELRRPRLSESGSRLRLTVKLLDEAPVGLTHVADDLDQRPPRRFEDATLFIDDAADTMVRCTTGDIHYMAGETFEDWDFPNLVRADSRLLSVEVYSDLFAAIGTRFGGDGQERFAVPEVDGPAPSVYAFICAQGEAQTGGECLVGEIRTTSDLRAVPANWYPTDGQLLQISEHHELYALIGNSFGGDGETTFALPTIEPSSGLSNQICYFGRFPQPDRKGTAGAAAARGSGTPGVIANDLMAGLRLTASPRGMPDDVMSRANGAQLSIEQNQELYELLGTTFGGDGQSNFALPNVPSPGDPMLTWFVNFQGIYPPRQ